MKEFTLPKNWNKGLGTELGVFCTLLDYGVNQLNIYKELNNKNFELYKKIFNVPNGQLQVNQTDIILNEIYPSDLFKVNSPYLKLHKNSKIKKFIGIAGYQDSHIYENPSLDYPQSKFYSLKEYALIYKHIKKCGFEVITLDSKDISLEDKVFLISNFCYCVVGYEGGLAHLCHMTDTPYVMLPWRIKFDEKLLHLDEKTYFLNNIQELLNWSKSQFLLCIDKLYNGQGNNNLLTDKKLLLDVLSAHPRSQSEIDFLNKK